MNDLPTIRDLEHLKRRVERIAAANTTEASGTAFPSSPPTGLRFYRSDLGWWCFYDGARWLTCHELSAQRGVTGLTVATSVPISDIRQDYAPYVARCTTGYVVATTNNGSNYWTITIRGVNAAYNAASSVHQFNTSAASLTWAQNDAAPSVSAAPSNRARIDVDLAVTGAPGSLSIYVTVYYRLIVT
ncbi:MAG TPA: hypothetical protein VFZ66_29630 [Herpetosiphonaceae bacterium]